MGGLLTAFAEYLALVGRLGVGGINRSENDLSSNLKNALASFGLYGVVDTGSGSERTRRPDIALYIDLAAADVGSAADVVIESKKPQEIAAFPGLLEALVDDYLWNDKFIPYVRAHSERVRYFILTTFDRFLIVPVSTSLRRDIQREGSLPDQAERREALTGAVSFDLTQLAGGRNLAEWAVRHLTPATLSPPPLSSIVDIKRLDGAEALEEFASALADVVVGPEGRPTPGGALLATINLRGQTLADLEPAAQQGLVIYTMAAHGGMTIDAAQRYLTRHLEDELAEFINASIHSLVGRLFSIKAIEDCFCVGTHPPLIPQADWVFHTARHDEVEPDQLAPAFFAALGALANASNPAVRDMAATGRFYDWLAPQVDPAAFRRLLQLFCSHSLADLRGDLLGRFFEIYAQRVDRRRRKQLGQYYTPLPIVRHMWRISLDIARERGALPNVIALDPGVGSGTFLIEGANQLHAAGIRRFWEKLTGFDISAQAIGIAQVNLYLAILAHLDREEAEAVGMLRLYPTDALDPRNGAILRSIMPLLMDETTRTFVQRRIDLSETIKQKAHFPLVIGNPPYRNNSDRTLGQIADRFPRLMRSSRDNARARKRNIRDDYAWFFAAADHYLDDQGVITFVVSDSFCYAMSYRFFREDLLRHYRVRHLLNLGASVFRDVGPRTQFVIVSLERRAEELGSADNCGPLQYVDLRPLAADAAVAPGSADDPRLVALDSNSLPPYREYTPTRDRNFSLFPAASVVSRVNALPVALWGDTARRVFLRKWPGLITAFDELFRGKTQDELTSKMRLFFSACELDSGDREAALDDLALQIRATSAKNRGRLSLMARQVVDSALQYDPSKIQRVVTGSAPNSLTWYPDERMTAWIYYEPRLAVPRNINEGRNPGWGTMSQWRDHESHTIDPKFVFTTSTNPNAGFKAFVLPGNWMVKLHGGESQQFHYTGISLPWMSDGLAGPNNLGSEALSFYWSLATRGHDGEALLHYLAGIYNSQLSEDYLDGGGANAMRVPLDPAQLDSGVVDSVISASRALRNLHWVALEARNGNISAELAEQLVGASGLEEFEFEELPGSGGRFVQRRTWRAGARTVELLQSEITRLGETVDDLVNELYPAPS